MRWLPFLCAKPNTIIPVSPHIMQRSALCHDSIDYKWFCLFQIYKHLPIAASGECYHNVM